MIRPCRSILPRADPSAFVDQRAQVIADVAMGPESSAWIVVTQAPVLAGERTS
jgi:hypothetical protein